MSLPRRINEGDKVSVFLTVDHQFDGTVVYTPAASGDVWTIVEENGVIHDVQTFAQIVKYPES